MRLLSVETNKGAALQRRLIHVAELSVTIVIQSDPLIQERSRDADVQTVRNNNLSSSYRVQQIPRHEVVF